MGDTLQTTLLNAFHEKIILIKIPLMFVDKGCRFDSKLALHQVTAWHRTDYKLLLEPVMTKIWLPGHTDDLMLYLWYCHLHIIITDEKVTESPI